MSHKSLLIAMYVFGALEMHFPNNLSSNHYSPSAAAAANFYTLPPCTGMLVASNL